MKVTSDQVKALQKRIDITYEEAEKFIQRAKGDIDQAEVMVKAHRSSFWYRLVHESERLFNELLTYHVKVETNDRVVLHLPLILLFGMFMILTVDSKIWITVITIGLVLISESEVSIERIDRDGGFIRHWRRGAETQQEQKAEAEPKPEPEPERAKEAPVSDEEAAPEETVPEPVQEQVQTGPIEDDDDDDYYEITIEK